MEENMETAAQEIKRKNELERLKYLSNPWGVQSQDDLFDQKTIEMETRLWITLQNFPSNFVEACSQFPRIPRSEIARISKNSFHPVDLCKIEGKYRVGVYEIELIGEFEKDHTMWLDAFQKYRAIFNHFHCKSSGELSSALHTFQKVIIAEISGVFAA
ncbi:MAG: hypothetical protein MMC33_008602 [Icmadophila ericetorum]|nr:hypothetical protein [Icmadophila ericetorum]